MRHMHDIAMAGRPRGSRVIDCRSVRDVSETMQVGSDAAVVLPRHDVLGVFDGADGATDIGSPRVASMAACRAVERYFDDGGQSVAEAMELARQAVTADAAAGICVGSIARVIDGQLMVAHAGDTAVAVCRDGTDDAQRYIAQPQRDEYRQPTNYLGAANCPGRLPERTDDEVASYELRAGDTVVLMSDGAWSVGGELLAEYQLAAALADWPLFERAKAAEPGLQEAVRQLLHSSAARELREQEIAAHTDGRGRLDMGAMSQGLLDPSQYTLEHTDWLLWQEIIQPHLRERGLMAQRRIGAAAVARALLARPIRWPFEAPVEDDATVVVVRQLL